MEHEGPPQRNRLNDKGRLAIFTRDHQKQFSPFKLALANAT